MNKEEILEKSRREQAGGTDELETQAIIKAGNVGMLAGGLICVLLAFISRWLLNRFDYALVGLMIYFSMLAVTYLVTYKLIKKKMKLITGIICCIFAAACLVAFIIMLLQKKTGA